MEENANDRGAELDAMLARLQGERWEKEREALLQAASDELLLRIQQQALKAELCCPTGEANICAGTDHKACDGCYLRARKG